jgi:hypothetical protein
MTTSSGAAAAGLLLVAWVAVAGCAVAPVVEDDGAESFATMTLTVDS